MCIYSTQNTLFAVPNSNLLHGPMFGVNFSNCFVEGSACGRNILLTCGYSHKSFQPEHVVVHTFGDLMLLQLCLLHTRSISISTVRPILRICCEPVWWRRGMLCWNHTISVPVLDPTTRVYDSWIKVPNAGAWCPWYSFRTARVRRTRSLDRSHSLNNLSVLSIH